mgnify:CR=1 FL=1
MKTYTHLFFDLDHTLWDFDTNARTTLAALYEEFGLQQWGATSEAFISTFFVVLHELWDAYNRNQITKEGLREQRFVRIGERLTGKRPAPMPELEAAYVRRCSRQGVLMPYTDEVLNYLRRAGYRLHILTNGFRESQRVKLESAGIAGFFETVTTSECTGEKKPHPAIFQHALQQAQATTEEVILIGDNPETDLRGAYGVKWDSVFYNPDKKVSAAPFTHEVRCLSALRGIF